jgi:hypothetical protein
VVEEEEVQYKSVQPRTRVFGSGRSERWDERIGVVSAGWVCVGWREGLEGVYSCTTLCRSASCLFYAFMTNLCFIQKNLHRHKVRARTHTNTHTHTLSLLYTHELFKAMGGIGKASRALCRSHAVTSPRPSPLQRKQLASYFRSDHVVTAREGGERER